MSSPTKSSVPGSKCTLGAALRSHILGRAHHSGVKVPLAVAPAARWPSIPSTRSRSRSPATTASHLGPGLLEAPYERALCFELARRGIPFRSQVPIPLTFKGDNVGDYYADLIVADRVLIEIKSVVALGNAHLAQILSYLATTKLRIGLLLNFNVTVLVRGGVKRVVR
jgi:GxxExxY protein